MLLQERIYKAWRSKKVLSLISFDIKGAYNGVCKERLLLETTGQGNPTFIVRWVDLCWYNPTGCASVVPIRLSLAGEWLSTPWFPLLP